MKVDHEAREQASAAAAEGQAHSIARNSLFALAAQLTSAAFTAVLTLFLVRALDPTGYGTFALALALGTLLVLPSDLGISMSASRFIAERRGDLEGVAGVLADALRLKLLAAGTLSVGLVAAAGPLASGYGNDDLAWPIRGVAIAVFGQSLMLLFGGAFVAQGRTAANLRIALMESAVETGASIGLVLLGAGAAGAAFGRAIGYAVGAVIGLALLLRFLGLSLSALRRTRAGLGRRIVRYAGPLFVIEAAFALFVQVDAIIIGVFLTTTAVGLFQAPMQLMTFLHYPGLALALGVAPRLVRHERQEPRVGAFLTALRALVLFQAALVPPLVVWADPIVELVLGSDYAESADVLRALTPYVFLLGLAPLVSLAANYMGVAGRRVPIALAALGVNVAIDVVLVPEIGIVAGAIGTGVAFGIYVPAHLWICRDVLGVSLRPLLLTLVRASVAAAAMAGVLLTFGTADLALAEWVVGSAAAGLAYLAVLLATREVGRTEAQTAWSAVSGLLPGRASPS